MSVKVVVNVVDGPSQGSQFEFSSGEISIGRGRCDLMLRDKKISGTHCKLSISKGELWLEDLNSTNGTFFGGDRISIPVQLQNMDEFVLGLSRITVSIVESLIPELSQSTIKASFPSETPEYRETGIRRIEALIDDEMASVSKWDHPEVKDIESPSSLIVPTIKVTLTKIKGPEGLTNFICSEPITTMGRRGVDIKLNDLDCSRLHAQIEIVGSKKALIKDLASTNGTFLNGKKTSTEELKTGDIIQVGQTFLKVSIEGEN